MIRALLLFFGLVLFGAPSRDDEEIVRRHDRPDSLYVQLGRDHPALAHLNLPTPQGAADGEEYDVDSIVLHPDWDHGPHDLALLRFGRPVRGIAPARLYRGSAELDRVVVLVGYGDFGTGLTGPQGNDRQVRGATNRIDEATDLWLKFRFDQPGDPRTTPLEGVSGPGDSGGPAFLDGVAGPVLVGVSSGQSTRAAEGPGRYGAVEYYVRVSRYLDWIETVTGPLRE